jgi:hypothetical protein
MLLLWFSGDGNFSFSAALVCQLETSKVPLESLYCTSFDSKESLAAKYPDTVHRLQTLQKGPRESWVHIVHDVDATRIESVLGHLQRTFDDIIFNFPHLGFEDINRHQCLLAHIINSAKLMLRRPGGSVAIALAESQGIAWQM